MLGFTFNPQKRFADLTASGRSSPWPSRSRRRTRASTATLPTACRPTYPASAEVFDRMPRGGERPPPPPDRPLPRAFGEHIPLIRRQDVKGFVTARAGLADAPLGLDAVRKQAEPMELETRRFYERPWRAGHRRRHPQAAGRPRRGTSARTHPSGAPAGASSTSPETSEQARRRRAAALFVLQIVQPGLAGLMDGSVSTLAPLFAAAFATARQLGRRSSSAWPPRSAPASPWASPRRCPTTASLTGRGHPWLRGAICGLMTTLGGIGHTLPFLIPDFTLATALAIAVVLVELWAIAWIRHRYMDTPFLPAAFQVVVGGVAGVPHRHPHRQRLIGSCRICLGGVACLLRFN